MFSWTQLGCNLPLEKKIHGVQFDGEGSELQPLELCLAFCLSQRLRAQSQWLTRFLTRLRKIES